MQSFSERMAEAKEVAANRRYKGQSTSAHPSHKAKQRHHERGSWEFLCYDTKKAWRSDVKEFLNQFQQFCLNGEYINDL